MRLPFENEGRKSDLSGFFGDIDGDGKLGQCFGICGSGTLGHQLGCVLNLRECDDVADVGDAEHVCNKSVEAEGKAAVGRSGPPPISVPLRTISYAFARTDAGSESISGRSSSMGLVKG